MNFIGIIQRLSHKKKKLTWSQMILSIFPMFQWLPKYKWHTDLFHDIVSGFTVGIMHIPQGKNSKNYLIKYSIKLLLFRSIFFQNCVLLLYTVLPEN